MQNFNSRLYTRGDASQPSCINYPNTFQFTPLHERRRNRCLLMLRPYMNFNSRLYTRGDKAGYLPDELLSIISIHASTREATQTHHQHYMCCFYFNSRLYMRGSSKNAQFFQQNRCNFLPNLVFFIVTSRKVVFFSIPVQYFL